MRRFVVFWGVFWEVCPWRIRLLGDRGVGIGLWYSFNQVMSGERDANKS
jgi:hypothetical protein